MPLPAVVTIREGGVEPRYPSVPGRMKAKKVEVEERPPSAEPSGPKRVKLLLPPPVPSNVQVLGKGAGRRARRGRPVRGAGGAVPMILTLVEKNLDGSAVEVSLEALTFARSLSAAGGGVPVDAVVVGEADRRAAQGAGGVRRPQRLRRRRRRRLGVLRRRLGLRDPVGARAEQVGRRDGGRHRPRQRADGPRGRARRRGDGRQRAVVPRAGAVRGHPPGRRRCGARGDAARPAAGGVLGRRPRRRGRAGRRARRRRRRRAHAGDRRRRPGGAGGLHRADRGRRVRLAEVRPGRRRRGSRCGRRRTASRTCWS